MWITDGINSKKIKKEELIPEGWIKGRKNEIKIWKRLSNGKAGGR